MKKLLVCCALSYCATPAAAAPAERGVFLSLTRLPAGDFVRPQDFAALDRGELPPQRAVAGDLLRYVPAVQLRSNGLNGSVTAAMRGFSARRVAVLFDGVKLPADITGTVDLANLPGDGVDRVEVMPGAWSSVYGANAEGGVINLIGGRLNPGARAAEAGAEWSGYGGRASFVKAGAATDRGELFVTGRTSYSSGFQQNSASDRNSGTARASYDFGAAGKLKLRGFQNAYCNGLPTGTPVPISQWDGKKERRANSLTDFQTGEMNLLGAAYEVPLGRGARLEADASRSNSLLYAWQWGSGTRLRTQNRSASLKAALPGGSVLGAEYSRDLLASRTYGGHDAESRGFYAQGLLRPAEGLEVVPGLRYDANSRYADQLSPKLAVVYAPSFNWKFSAQAGRAWQAPTFADMYDPWVPAVDRSPDLKPERSVQAQGGLQWNADCGFYLAATGYYADVKDRIALDPAKSWAAYNLASAFNSGFEGEAGFKSAAFSASAAFNYLESQGRESAGTYRRLAFSPRRRVTAQAVWKPGGAELAARGRCATEQYTAPGSTGVRLPPYCAADVWLSRRFGALELGAGADNVLDRHYAETADAFNGWFPQPGRVLKGEVKLRFL